MGSHPSGLTGTSNHLESQNQMIRLGSGSLASLQGLRQVTGEAEPTQRSSSVTVIMIPPL